MPRRTSAPPDAPADVPTVALDVAAFRAALLGWFAANARDLPWRRKLSPYRVWLSEIMLQQTQMDRAVGYFQRFTERFPDVASLAAAPEDEVLKLWEGLGYYSRAKNLQRAARVIMAEHGGEFPREYSAIRALPGVGPYTAGAVASIAFGDMRPAVDANVLRVFSRLLDIDASVSDPAVRRRVEAAAAALLPPGQARAFNQALMELGALVCVPRRPRCPECPVAGQCLALYRGTVGFRPITKAGPEIVRIDMACGVLADSGEVYIQKRRADDVWPGLWEFPGGCLEPGESPEQALVREYREETGLDVRPEGRIGVERTSRTRYRMTLHGFFCRAAPGLDVRAGVRVREAAEGRFVSPRALREFAFPAGHARLVAELLADVRLADFLGGRKM